VGRWLGPALLVLVLAPPAAHAIPIPEGADAGELPRFEGAPASPSPVSAVEPPRHPFMAPNGLSNLHVDAWQTDRNRWFGPLGRDTRQASTFQAADCASVTFDSRGRIVTICVGLEGPRLMLFDPRTLEELARLQLPPRQLQAGSNPNPFTNFSGGGYFYLDHRDRAVIPTTTRRLLVVGVTAEGRFAVQRDYDLTGAVPITDAIISALPNWSGRIWFASTGGVVGTLDPATGAVRSRQLEANGNSFAVGEEGAVYLVTNAAMYRLDAAADGTPQVTWREPYENIGQTKPGQTQAGSGVTPSLMTRELVAITDNADPMNVLVLKRAAQVSGSRLVCRQPVFSKGQSATDNSLIVTERSIVVENNYGYTGPAATENGRTVPGGVERVDLSPGGGCRKVWHSDERSPTVVPKLSLSSGLVYVYTKPPREDRADPWYLTAIDFHTGRTVYRRLNGEGLGYNNNYAPITLAPDGTAFVGTLGGLTRLADATPPSFAPSGQAQPPGTRRRAPAARRGGSSAGREDTETASAAARSAKSHGRLPFTGLALGPLVLAGALLVAGGLGLSGLERLRAR
jgi:hypothetical protein